MTRAQAQAIIAALVTLRESATDEQALSSPVLYPAWRSGVAYVTGQRVLHNAVLYKVLQDHTSQDDWAPDAASSLFSQVLIPDENVIPEWVQPDSTNPYAKDAQRQNMGVWL